MLYLALAMLAAAVSIAHGMSGGHWIHVALWGVVTGMASGLAILHWR